MIVKDKNISHSIKNFIKIPGLKTAEKASAKAGLPPGSLIYIGDHKLQQTRMVFTLDTMFRFISTPFFISVYTSVILRSEKRNLQLRRTKDLNFYRIGDPSLRFDDSEATNHSFGVKFWRINGLKRNTLANTD